MRLKDLLPSTGIECPPHLQEAEVTGICYDSRKIKKGNIFVCLKGENTDGHIYVVDAVIRGALAVISEEALDIKNIPILTTKNARMALSVMAANFYGHPSDKISIFGVTGTNGKTTITYMIKSVFDYLQEPCGLIGTISYKISDREYEATRTTPESSDLQAILAEMLESGIAYCTMEVSSHALQLGRVRDISFDYGIFTNLTQDHMDFHKDTEEYYQAKKRLFNHVRKAAIINIDDEAGYRLYEEIKGDLPCISCSMKNKKADFYCELQEADERGSAFELRFNDEPLGVLTTHTPGLFTLYNALLASACLYTAGFPISCINKGFSLLKGVPGRFERVENSKNIPVIVDYAHTPDALEKVLITGSDIVKGRLICVFGCGGDRDRTKRPLMGKVAGSYADFCIVTSDNPRTESQQQIASDIEEGLYETGCNYEIIDDRRKAIARALSMYKKGDLIVITGKGHETYQIIGGSKTYFSDRETVQEILNEDNEV